MKQILVEGFDYHDLVGQIFPEISVDEYSAKMGSDDNIVTLAFTVKGKAVGEDLSDWFERGYIWVLDAQVSEGEITPGKYLVFVEIDRRMAVPERIVQLIEDLETLTDMPLSEWTIEVDDEKHKNPTVEVLKSKIILSPHQYREKYGTEEEQEKKDDNKIDEMKNLSGLDPSKKFKEPDSLLKDFIAKAGL
jgi:hypothetical protein